MASMWSCRFAVLAVVLAALSPGGASRRVVAAQTSGFWDNDYIEQKDGTILKGRITRINRDFIYFHAAGERRANGHSRKIFSVKHWVGVTDAALRVRDARRVERRIRNAVAIPDRSGEPRDLDAMAAAVRRAQSRVSRVRSVSPEGMSEGSGYDTRALAAQAQDVARRLEALGRALAALLEDADLFGEYHRWLSMARTAGTNRNMVRAATACARAAACLDRLTTLDQLSTLGLDGRREALDAAALTLANTQPGVLDDVDDLELPDLPGAYALLSQQLRNANRGLPECLGLAEWHAKFRRRLITYVDCLRLAVREADPVLEDATRIRKRIASLEQSRNTNLEWFRAQIASTDREIARLQVGQMSRMTERVMAQTRKALGERLARLKDRLEGHWQATWLAARRHRHEKALRDWSALVDDASAGLAEKRVRDLLRKAETGRDHFAACLAEPKGSLGRLTGKAAAQWGELQEQIRGDVANAKGLSSLLAEIRRLYSMQRETGDDPERAAVQLKPVREITKRLGAAAGNSAPALAKPLSGVLGAAQKLVALGEYGLTLQKAATERGDVAALVATGRMGDAWQGVERLDVAIAEFRKQAKALGVPPPLSLEQSVTRLRTRIHQAITEQRVAADWVVPEGLGDAVPPTPLNRWQALRIVVAGGDVAKAETLLKDIEARPLPKQWPLRVAMVRGELVLLAGRRHLQRGDTAQAVKAFEEAARLAPNTPVGHAAAAAVERIRDEWLEGHAIRIRRQILWISAIAVPSLLAVVLLVVLARRSPLRGSVRAFLGEPRPGVIRRPLAFVFGVPLADDGAALDAADPARKNRKKVHDVRHAISRQMRTEPTGDDLLKAAMEASVCGPEICGIGVAWLTQRAQSENVREESLAPVKRWLAANLAHHPRDGNKGAAWREQLAKRIVGVFPNEGVFWLACAENAVFLGHHESAEEACRAALECSLSLQQMEVAVIGLARELLAGNRAADATQVLRDASSGNPGSKSLTKWLGIATGALLASGNVKRRGAVARTTLSILGRSDR